MTPKKATPRVSSTALAIEGINFAAFIKGCGPGEDESPFKGRSVSAMWPHNISMARPPQRGGVHVKGSPSVRGGPHGGLDPHVVPRPAIRLNAAGVSTSTHVDGDPCRRVDELP